MSGTERKRKDEGESAREQFREGAGARERGSEKDPASDMRTRERGMDAWRDRERERARERERER